MAYTGKKGPEANLEYERLREDLKAGTPRRAYVFYGEERYILADCLQKLRDMIPAETAEFNHHRLDARSFDPDAFALSVDALPVFAERTLVEVRDTDFSKLGEEARRSVVEVLKDVPDYATVVFVCPDGVRPDWRSKTARELEKLLTKVDFERRGERELRQWVIRELKREGKRITNDAADRFVLMTGGLLTNMRTELDKLIAYSGGEAIEQRDVELLVAPVADARLWFFTDAVVARDADRAFARMGELLRMPDTDAYSVIYALASVTRQLTAACICRARGVSQSEFMALAGVKNYTSAKNLMAAAGRVSLKKSAEAARLCCETVLRLNSTAEDKLGAAKELTARVLLTLGVRA